jgi:hypothetical protein
LFLFYIDISRYFCKKFDFILGKDLKVRPDVGTHSSICGRMNYGSLVLSTQGLNATLLGLNSESHRRR